MTLEQATQIINYEIASDAGEQLEAYKVFFKEMYNVDVQNEDGTFKTLNQIFEEGHNNIVRKENKNEQENSKEEKSTTNH